MKLANLSDRSFFAKMLLLFALLLLGHAHKRGELNESIRTLFKKGNISQIQPSPVAASPSFTSHLSR